MRNEDFIYSPGWCPICGAPEEVCDAYGDCPRAMGEGREWEGDWDDIWDEMEKGEE